MNDKGIDDSAGISHELPVLPPIATRTVQKCSSSKVQMTPEIEKKYVHRVYDAIAPTLVLLAFRKMAQSPNILKRPSLGLTHFRCRMRQRKYLGLNPIAISLIAPLINICTDKGHDVLVADAVNLPYRTGYGDAAISIAVLHHLSTESRRKGAVEELIRVVKPGGLVLITVWAREQEDKSLLNKWTPLTQKYLEEWIGPGSPRVRSPSSSLSLESIPETEEAISGEHLKDFTAESGDESLNSKNKKSSLHQQEYFVPWHLPYHRVEVSGASANAVANGLARKDDKKGAVVYDRYYHVFSEGELERHLGRLQFLCETLLAIEDIESIITLTSKTRINDSLLDMSSNKSLKVCDVQCAKVSTR
ncbi:hypothetical protein DH2020_008020 [Rehmannia glutinosa]|uniref:Methyltransferase type 11 domain-containing protein n=1 Tax=Rehmannia glutinosa TaxID=99300 RepID=A0ABR0U0N8_REHGL